MNQLRLLPQVGFTQPVINVVKNARTTILLGLLMSSIMSFVLSFLMTWVHSGLGDGFIAIWARNLSLSFSVAAPLALSIMPIVRRMVYKIARESR